MAFCPNLSDPDVRVEFDILKHTVGENIAYTLWNKHEGNVAMIYEEIAIREEDKASTATDKRVDEAIVKYGDEIDNRNNPYLWDIENDLGLIHWKTDDEGTKKKLPNLFTYGTAATKADRVRQAGGYATVKEIYTKSSKGRWAVIAGYDISKPTHRATISGRYTVKPEDLDDVNLMMFYIDESDNVVAPLRYMKDKYPEVFKNNADLQYMYDRVIKNSGRLSDIGLNTSNSLENDTYMQFTGTSIEINRPAAYSKPNKEAFIASYIHELTHAFTVQAIEQPTNKVEKEFSDTMKTLYTDVLRLAPEFTGAHAMEDVLEFTASIFANSAFAEELDNMMSSDGSKAKKSWLQKIIDAIVKLFGATKESNPSVYKMAKSHFNYFFKKADSFNKDISITENGEIKSMFDGRTFRQIMEDGHKAERGNPKSIRDALKSIAKDFEYDAKDHTYKYKPTNTLFTSVTERMTEYGYGIDVDKLTDDQAARLESAANLGTAIHLTLEGQVTDVVKDIEGETGFKMTDEARNQLSRYLENLKKESKSVIAMSEVMVADPEMQLAGKVDLILIDDKGRIRIFDFKTKERGFKYYQSTKFGKSDQSKYRMQSSMYKNMIEKSLGVQVYDMNIVHFRPTLNTSDEITKVALDFSYDSSAIDNFRNLPFSQRKSLKNIYGERLVKFDKHSLVEKLELDGIEDESTYFEYQLDRKKVDDEALTDIEQLAEKAKEALLRRYEIVQSKYSFVQRKDFEEFIDELMEIESATDTLLSIINHSARITNTLLAEHAELRKNNKPYTVEMLNKWRDYLIAYESLGQIQDMIKKDNTLFKDPKILRVLSKTVENRDFLVNLYENEGKKLIAEWLTPYYDGVRREMRDKIEKDYRRQIRKKSKKGMSMEDIEKEIGTKEEFVDRIITERDIDLDKDTYELLLKELTTAARDIGDMARYFDNMLDTPDPVAAAMVAAFMESHDKSRIESLEKRTDILEHLRELEKAKGKGNFESELDFYSFALEFDDKGKPTQYLLKPWKSDLLEEERTERSKLYKDFTREEAESKLTAWRKAHLVLNEEDYDDALSTYLLEMVKLEVISQQDYDNIMRNQLSTKLPMQALVKSEQVTDQAAELTIQWMGENRWKYSEVHEDFRNPQWDAWLKDLGIQSGLKQWEQIDAVEKSDNVEAKFYNYINELSREADSMLPFSHRNGYKLPGVAKINSERIKEGQDPLTYAKETFKSDVFVRPEDTERGNKELTDENGNAKFFLPIHYTADIELQNQSFDLAGIYYKYWESANDFKNKREILAEMEMAKFFVDNRSAMKRNAMGDIIKRAAATVGVGDQDEQTNKPSLKSNTKLAMQLNDWFEMAVYGKKSHPGSIVNVWGKEIDVSKLIDKLTNYTSMNLLAINVVQGAANTILGDTMQAIEAFAGEYVSIKSLTQGTDYYMRNMPKMMADVGLRAPESTASLLIEHFDIMHEDAANDTTFSKKSRVGQLMNKGSLFFVQSAGEHWMQSRFLFAMMKEKRAIDDNDKDIGSMLDQYYSDKGRLKIRKVVNLKKSNWTENDQERFKLKTKRILSRMHGEYSDLGRVAVQRMALGRMAYQFRKFIMPGMKRRWAGKRYIQGLDQFTEGNYVTTGRFVKDLIKEQKILSLSLMSEEWSSLSNHEKANVKRTIGELGFLTLAIIVAGALMNMDGDDEDEWFISFMTYQALRFQSELLFFINPGDAMKILRSPMASMSVLENMGKLLNQMFSAGEVYERGPWKGQLKIKRTMVNFVPVYKQYYRARDVDEQIKFFR
jgi:hypothetical protein